MRTFNNDYGLPYGLLVREATEVGPISNGWGEIITYRGRPEPIFIEPQDYMIEEYLTGTLQKDVIWG